MESVSKIDSFYEMVSHPNKRPNVERMIDLMRTKSDIQNLLVYRDWIKTHKLVMAFVLKMKQINMDMNEVDLFTEFENQLSYFRENAVA